MSYLIGYLPQIAYFRIALPFVTSEQAGVQTAAALGPGLRRDDG